MWALGDGARVPNRATPDRARPTDLPARPAPGPPAGRSNLLDEPRPYRYRMLGQVATLGRYRGIANVLGVRFRGFRGWFVTRTYHLYQLPLFRRKLRVVADWTVSVCFRRDIVELGSLGRRAGARPMQSDDVTRAFAAMRRTEYQGTKEEPFRFGTAALTPELPLRHDSNFLYADRLHAGRDRGRARRRGGSAFLGGAGVGAPRHHVPRRRRGEAGRRLPRARLVGRQQCGHGPARAAGARSWTYPA